MARVGGERAGYAELVPRADGEVEIAMFGLRREFHGQGLGGWLLTAAARRAWELAGDAGGGRVWLHTCTLDGPHALANYQARGFSIYRTRDLPPELRCRRGRPGPSRRRGRGRPVRASSSTSTATSRSYQPSTVTSLPSGCL